MPFPDTDDKRVIQVVTGGVFQVVDTVVPEGKAPGDWKMPPSLAKAIHVEHIHGAPEWMTEADKEILQVESHLAVPWEHFAEMMAGRGETRIGAVEMKHSEDSSVSPGRDNDVIVAAGVMVWSDMLIATVKTAGKEDWPIAHRAYTLDHVFKAFPVR
jgi:hypothetical protein